MNLPILVLLFYLVTAILVWSTHAKHCWLLLIPALIAHAWRLASYGLQIGHIPVFTSVETLSFTAFIIGLLTVASGQCSFNQVLTRRWSLTIIVFLLTAATLWPSAAPCFDYNHNYSYAIAFIFFRRLALALALFASAIFMNALSNQNSASQRTAKLSYQGRNALMTAVILYLISEDIGIIWCLNGWADVWHWSPGFIVSSMIPLYLMLPFHLPGGNRKAGLWYSLTGLSCGPLMLIAQLYKH